MSTKILNSFEVGRAVEVNVKLGSIACIFSKKFAGHCVIFSIAVQVVMKMYRWGVWLGSCRGGVTDRDCFMTDRRSWGGRKLIFGGEKVGEAERVELAI